MYRQDLKADLQSKAKAKKISKSAANRIFIETLEGKFDHIFHGDLPFPEKRSSAMQHVLAGKGQVLYLYTKEWR
jgi:hypothetical protein